MEMMNCAEGEYEKKGNGTGDGKTEEKEEERDLREKNVQRLIGRRKATTRSLKFKGPLRYSCTHHHAKSHISLQLRALV